MPNSTLTITVTVAGSPGNYTVTIVPLSLTVDSDGIYTIVWQAGDGVAFTFDSNTPITFFGAHVPLTQPAYDPANNTATCTDTVTGDGDYPYQVHLLVGSSPITWPSQRTVGNGDPDIHNDPE